MAVIWNIFVKDCRRLKILLLLYFLLIEISLVVNSSAILDNLARFESFEIVLVYVPLLQALLIWVIIGQLVHEDPVIDPRAFWLTRPISRWDVLAAKSLFLLVFIIILPMFFMFITIMDNGFYGIQIIGALQEFIRSRVPLLLPCILLASMTRNFGGYTFASVLLILVWSFHFRWAGYYVPSCFLDKINDLFQNPRLNGMMPDYSLQASLNQVKLLLDTMFGIFLVIHQFISRRTARTLMWFAVWVIVAFLVGRFWAWDFLNVNASYQLSIADSVKVEIDPNDVSEDEGSSYSCEDSFREKKNVELSYPVSIKNLLPRQFAYLVMAEEPIIILPNRGALMGNGIGKESDPPVRNDIYWDSLTRVLSNTRIVDYPQKEKYSAPLLALDPDILDKNSGLKGSLIVGGIFKVYEWVLIDRFALGQKERAATPHIQVAVTGIRIIPDGLSIVIQYKGLPGEGEGGSLWGMYMDRPGVILRNRITGEAFGGERGKVIVAWGPYYFPGLITGVNNIYQEYVFSADDSKKGGAVPEITKAWLKDAELIFVRQKELGFFKKRIYVKNLRLNSKDEKDYVVKDGERINYYLTGEPESASPNIFKRTPVLAKRYYKSGGVNTESTYCSGLKEGITREYYPAGELMYEYFYHQDLLEGKLRKYDKAGRLLFEKIYIKGKLVEPPILTNP